MALNLQEICQCIYRKNGKKPVILMAYICIALIQIVVKLDKKCALARALAKSLEKLGA
jgi:hypothetical protein